MSIPHIVRTRLLMLIILTVGLTGCSKLVSVAPPVSSITTEQVFTSADHANSAIAALYSMMMNNSGSMNFSNGATSIYAGLSSDEMINTSGTLIPQDYQFYTNTLQATATTDVYTYFWQPAWSLIYGANAAVDGLAAAGAKVDDSTRNQLTGEAKFIRAFSYFYLTNFFGDIPLVLSTDFNVTAQLKKSLQTVIYQQMISDLKDAKLLLPTDYAHAGGERIRANRWSAAALLARVYLYTQDWTDAAAEADSIIGNSQYSLPAALSDVFLSNSTEAIFQLQQNPIVPPDNATWEGENFVPQFRWETFAPSDQATFLIPSIFSQYYTFLLPRFHLTNQFVSSFEPGDLRRSAWIDSTPTPPDTPYNGITVYYPTKYTSAIGVIGGAITQYYTVLRLAEVYLIRAEARAQLGNDLSGAAADINALRIRAGLAPTAASSKSDLLTAVAHERRTELFAEWGHRWFDLKRTSQAHAVLSALPYKQPWSDNSLLYPIPTQEITSDPSLIQNTGY